MAGLLDFIQALREGADWAKRDIQKIGADPVASAKGAGTGFVKGVSTDLLGMPVDTGVNLYNLGKAGVGTVGGLFGMRPENLPALTEKKDVPGSSEWLEEQVRKRGGGQFIDAPQGSSEIASLLGNVVAPGPKGAKSPKLEVMTYHGTPHNVPKYDLSKIGTGEGAQAYGHGMYFAENPATAGFYKEVLSSGKPATIEGAGVKTEIPAWLSDSIDRDGIDYAIKEWSKRVNEAKGEMKSSLQPWLVEQKVQGLQNTLDEMKKIKSGGGIEKMTRGGNLYKQDLPDEFLPRMLQWDKPLSEQPEAVRKALAAAGEKMTDSKLRTGGQAYGLLASRSRAAGLPNTERDPLAAAELLRSLGIPGVSYFDAGSRGATTGTRNHVIWDQSLLDRMLPQRVE